MSLIGNRYVQAGDPGAVSGLLVPKGTSVPSIIFCGAKSPSPSYPTLLILSVQ